MPLAHCWAPYACSNETPLGHHSSSESARPHDIQALSAWYMVRHDARCHLQKKGVLFALVTAPHCMAWRHSHCSVGQGAETPQHDVEMSNQLFQVQQKAAQHLGPTGALCALVVCQRHELAGVGTCYRRNRKALAGIAAARRCVHGRIIL